MFRLACTLFSMGIIVIIAGSDAHTKYSKMGRNIHCGLKHDLMLLAIKYPCVTTPNPGKRITSKDCADLYKKGNRRSGVYQIRPFSSGAKAHQLVSVYCDMKTDGGGWTVFQRRFNGHVDFYRNWAAYKAGFGNAKGEYWLGNDIIHALTTHHPSELRVDLEDWKGKKAYAKYGVFSVAGSNLKYRLLVARYSGPAGNSLAYHNGQAFSTHDKDSDKWAGGNCASSRHGAWWYKGCEHSNLNGRYHYSAVTSGDGVFWYHWQNKRVSLMRTEMKVRPSHFKLG